MSDNNKPSSVEILQQLNSVGDSVNLVMSIMARNERSPETMEKMHRNYLHILDACENSWYSDFNMNMYFEVGTAAKNWYNGA